MIIDTSPVITLLSEKDSLYYKDCQRTFESFRGELLTTFPCLTEAMHLLGNWHYQSKLWEWIESGAVGIYYLNADDLSRMKVLMEKYNDTPMDFADASLVAAAESLNVKRIFT
jgi:uncharacterized protein